MGTVARLVSQKAVVIISKSSCCMCHTIKTLFYEQGVSPGIYEIDADPRGNEVEQVIVKELGCKPAVPVVFVGGKLLGSASAVMAVHLNGALNKMLKDAGALWL